MFERPHHRRVAQLLAALDGSVLQKAGCYFGGGTAIALSLQEYRESLDIDFLVSSTQGYRLIRNLVSDDLGALLCTPVKHLREVRADRYGIRTVLEVDGVPIKFEIVSEGRIQISGALDPLLGVPTLSREDMFAEKLLANADRGLDKTTRSRDLIDLVMMSKTWGPIPEASRHKAEQAYGPSIQTALTRSIALVQDSQYLQGCLQAMKMEAGMLSEIQLMAVKLVDAPST